jgi:cation transport ATPase-like protein
MPLLLPASVTERVRRVPGPAGGGKAVTVSQETTKAASPGWHGAEADAVARELGVEPARGLSAEEAGRRLKTQGPNRLAGAKR